MTLTSTTHQLPGSIPDHVDVLYAVEVGFSLANFFAVEIHLLVGRIPLLVELVDN